MQSSKTLAALPPPLQRGVDVVRSYAPAEARSLEATIARSMRPLLEDQGDARRWRLSLLTDGGYPFEFTFTTAGDGVRYTLEVAPPRQAPQSRLQQVYTLLRELCDCPLDEEGLALLRRVQAGGSLSFGAWLGVRHNARGTAFKVYGEVPQEAQPQAGTHLSDLLRHPVQLANRQYSLQMIGHYPATGELEFYFRILELRPWEIVALLHPLGLEAQFERVLGCFQLAYGRPIFQKLPGPVFGFSYALNPAVPDDCGVFSLYTFAETMFGSDAAARRRLLQYCERAGVELRGYAQMSEPLAGRVARHTLHGLFGVAVTKDRPPIVSIGLRPPEPEVRAHG